MLLAFIKSVVVLVIVIVENWIKKLFYIYRYVVIPFVTIVLFWDIFPNFLTGLPEPHFLAGAGAVFWVRLRLLLLLLLHSTVNILFLRGPKYDYKYDYDYEWLWLWRLWLWIWIWIWQWLGVGVGVGRSRSRNLSGAGNIKNGRLRQPCFLTNLAWMLH